MSKPNFFRHHTEAIAALKPGQHIQYVANQGYYVMPGDRPSTPAPIGPGPAEPKSGFGVDPYTGLPKNKAPKPNPYVVPTRPRPPVAPNPMAALTPQQIEAQAGLQAQSQLTPQQDEIRRQQALAAAQAKADEGAITGFQTAAAGILGEMAPLAGQGYQGAAQEEGALGQGLATGVAQDVADRVAAEQEFMKSQGMSGGPGPDTAALHDAVYGLNGQIPGDTFAEQGAAQTAWGAAQPAISLNAGREEMDSRMAQARSENDQYAQQLIQVAQQYPGLKQQALAQLNQYEIDKANYRQSVRTNDANIASQKKQDALAARSESAQEIAAGIKRNSDAAQVAAEFQYKYAALNLRSKEDAVKIQAAQQEGKRVDVAASKLKGHVVYRNGSEDPSIKVQQSSTSTANGKATKARDDAMGKARVSAFNYATKIRGAPVKAPTGAKGAYIAGPGQKYGVPGGVFAPAGPGYPATTNDPNKAAHAGGASNYADAVTQVWAKIDGDGLMSRYGLSREQVMTIVKKALASAGWKRK